MASPRVSSGRAQLIREMSRDMGKTKNNNFHYENPTVTSHVSIDDISFTTTDLEAGCHYTDLEAYVQNHKAEKEKAAKQAEKKVDRKKYPVYDIPGTSYQIDTANLDRLFPDSTVSSISSGSSSGAMPSLENTRGAKKAKAKLDKASNKDDSIHSSKALVGGYRVAYTPPATTPRNNSKQAGKDHLRESVQGRLASVSQRDNPTSNARVSKASDTVAGKVGHASRTNDAQKDVGADFSHVVHVNQAAEHQARMQPTPTTRTTRFGSGNQAAAVNKQSAASVVINQLKQKVANATNGNATQTLTAEQTATAQSVGLPNMPHMTELVSGIFHDGTPVFSRHGNPQATRFVSRSGNTEAAKRAERANLDVLPLPNDEQAILVSLKLLQDRVAELEHGKAAAEVEVQEYQQENMLLKAERKEYRRHQRSDSALGVSEGNSDDGHHFASVTSKAAEKVLQARLADSIRKITVNETIIKNVSEERDAAVSQLGVAFNNAEELKADNDALHNENADMRAELDHLSKTMVNVALFQNIAEERNAAVSQLSVALNDIEVLKAENADLQSRVEQLVADAQLKRLTRRTAAAIADTQRNDSPRKQSQQEPITLDSPLSSPRRARRSGNSPQKERLSESIRRLGEDVSRVSKHHSEEQVVATEVPSRKMSKVVIESPHDSDDTCSDEATQTGVTQNVSTSHGDTTYLSVVGVSQHNRYDHGTASDFSQSRDISRLRQMIEADRLTRAGHSKQSNKDAAQSELIRRVFSTGPSESAPIVPRKSSMKTLSTEQLQDATLTGRLSIPNDADVSGNVASRFQRVSSRQSKQSARDDTRVSEHNMDFTEQSMRSEPRSTRRVSHPDGRQSKQSVHENMHVSDRRSVRDDTRRSHRHSAPEMTSAFIVPDITLRYQDLPELSKAAQRVLDEVAPHACNNCATCKQVVKEANSTKQTIKISKPVPVSDRMPSPGPYGDEPTIRPSQPPALALATVMKTLEDERAHLMIEQTRWQMVYNRHDASMSRRRRNHIRDSLESIAIRLEEKADQIYSLYDVLEGQKKNGDMMTEDEVEVTLMNLGIDTGLVQTDVVHESASDEEELPWEGVESA